VTILVTTEAHFVRGVDGRVHSTSGVDAYPFWRRYLDVFDRIIIAARTQTGQVSISPLVEGPGVRVLALPEYRGPWQYLSIRNDVAAVIREAIPVADGLCLRAPGRIAGLAWRLRGDRSFGVEVVGDPLDSLSRGAIRSVARPVARLVFARELRAMCSRATAVAYVTSGSLQQRYPARGWQTSYSSVELDDAAFATESDVERRYTGTALVNRGTKRDPWRLVLVGSLANRNKGADVAVDALALCRARGLQIILTIVGDGCERQALERQAQMSGVGNAITFLGQLPAGAAVRDVLDRSDMLVLPSRAEGVPRAMLEAMARGVPCIGSSAGGIPELLPPERCVGPGNTRQLAELVTRMYASRETLQAKSREDRLTARRYRYDVLQPRRRAFYKQLRAAFTTVAEPKRATSA